MMRIIAPFEYNNYSYSSTIILGIEKYFDCARFFYMFLFVEKPPIRPSLQTINKYIMSEL